MTRQSLIESPQIGHSLWLAVHDLAERDREELCRAACRVISKGFQQIQEHNGKADEQALCAYSVALGYLDGHKSRDDCRVELQLCRRALQARKRRLYRDAVLRITGAGQGRLDTAGKVSLSLKLGEPFTCQLVSKGFSPAQKS